MKSQETNTMDWIVLLAAVILAALIVIGGLVAGVMFLVKSRRPIGLLIRSHRQVSGLLVTALLSWGVVLYVHSVEAAQEQKRIQEVVFRDAMARFSRLVPPKPGEQYVLYETDGQAVSAALVQRLHDVKPPVVTGGDPEFYNSPNYRSFMVGDDEDDTPGQVSVWVNTMNLRSSNHLTNADGLMRYTLGRSGGRWVITGRKFEKEQVSVL